MSTMSALSCVGCPGEFIAFWAMIEKYSIRVLINNPIGDIQLEIFVSVF